MTGLSKFDAALKVPIGGYGESPIEQKQKTSTMAIAYLSTK